MHGLEQLDGDSEPINYQLKYKTNLFHWRRDSKQNNTKQNCKLTVILHLIENWFSKCHSVLYVSAKSHTTEGHYLCVILMNVILWSFS